MTAPARPPLSSIREVIGNLYTWLTHVTKASDGGLSLCTETSRLHLEGDAGDPAVARVGDLVVRLGLNVAVPSYSTSTSAPYTWTPIPAGSGPLGALTPADAGVAIIIAAGSEKVTCG